jgi:non-canonical poly(A) RNA polymerase PAPD5/7
MIFIYHGDLLTKTFPFQTINHRKLVQELYDQRVLHSILGVKPLPTVVKHIQTDEEDCYKPNSPSSRRQASKIVEDAWEETRNSRDYAYDESYRPRQHHRVTDEDGGRYDIGRHPPKKRRKTGRAIDDHPVIFVDDDDDDGRRGYDYDAEEGDYEDCHEGDVDRYPSYSEKSRDDRRRSYWLSKGIGPGSVFDDDVSY